MLAGAINRLLAVSALIPIISLLRKLKCAVYFELTVGRMKHRLLERVIGF